MNRVILMGRLTRDPEVRYSQGERSMAIARYTLAVDRRGRRSQDGDQGQTADFINIVAFDRAGEFAEKYFRQGMRVLVSGRIQTGSYVNKWSKNNLPDDEILTARIEKLTSICGTKENGIKGAFKYLCYFLIPLIFLIFADKYRARRKSLKKPNKIS